nr:MAG TPA: Gonadotropin-releasing hormone [Caudoviricetes sp.]
MGSGCVTTVLIRSGSHGDVVRERWRNASLSYGWRPV